MANEFTKLTRPHALTYANSYYGWEILEFFFFRILFVFSLLSCVIRKQKKYSRAYRLPYLHSWCRNTRKPLSGGRKSDLAWQRRSCNFPLRENYKVVNFKARIVVLFFHFGHPLYWPKFSLTYYFMLLFFKSILYHYVIMRQKFSWI